MNRIILDDGRDLAVAIGASVKVVRLTWFEVLGRAILNGATDREIALLEAEHRSLRLSP